MRMHSICEVFYDFYRASGRPDAFQAIADLNRVDVIQDASLTVGVWQDAGILKATLRRVSLADCFAINLAQRLKATILTAALPVLGSNGPCGARGVQRRRNRPPPSI